MLTPIKAIRAKCLDCCGGDKQEVRMCPVSDCPIFPYRMGHRPQMDTDTTESADLAKPVASPTFPGSNDE